VNEKDKNGMTALMIGKISLEIIFTWIKFET
jgi:hypothetical protein